MDQCSCGEQVQRRASASRGGNWRRTIASLQTLCKSSAELASKLAERCSQLPMPNEWPLSAATNTSVCVNGERREKKETDTLFEVPPLLVQISKNKGQWENVLKCIKKKGTSEILVQHTTNSCR